MLKRFVLTIDGNGASGSEPLARASEARLVVVGEREQRLDVTHLVMGAPVAAPLAVAPHLAIELVDREVDRRVHVLGVLVRTQHRTARPDGQLRVLARADRAVPLDRELEVHARVLREVALDARQLALRVLADRRADIQVPAADLKLHRVPPRSGSPVRCSLPSGGAAAQSSGRGVRARA